MAYIPALFVVLPHCKQETVPEEETELFRSVGGLTTALLFITACSSNKYFEFKKLVGRQTKLELLAGPMVIIHTSLYV